MLSICQAHSPDWSRKHQLKPPVSLWGKPSSSHPNAQHVLSSKENQTDGVDQTGIYWAGELKSRKKLPKDKQSSHSPRWTRGCLLVEVCLARQPLPPLLRVGSPEMPSLLLSPCKLFCLDWCLSVCTNPAVSREGSKSPTSSLPLAIISLPQDEKSRYCCYSPYPRGVGLPLVS